MTNKNTTNGAESDLPKLATPARRALTGAGITRLEQFTKLTEDEILQLHGMGSKAMGLIREALALKNLSFQDQNKDK